MTAPPVRVLPHEAALATPGGPRFWRRLVRALARAGVVYKHETTPRGPLGRWLRRHRATVRLGGLAHDPRAVDVAARRRGRGAMTRLFVLLATIPERRASLLRLLGELGQQTRPPDSVILCPDGYSAEEGAGLAYAAAAAWGGPLTVYPPAPRRGPGQRWRVAEDCGPEDLLVCLDDDAVLTGAPGFLEALASIPETTNGAAAAMGLGPFGHRAAPGAVSRGRLVLACACGLAVRAGHLRGLSAFAAEVLSAGGPDALGPCGDDQALVSAYLWQQKVPILHAATGPLSFAPGTQRGSQTKARQDRGEVTLYEQAQAIARVTGWPLPVPVVAQTERPALSWEGELDRVPEGARRAEGGAPAPGFRRVLVVDAAEAERSGVYDVPRQQ